MNLKRSIKGYLCICFVLILCLSMFTGCRRGADEADEADDLKSDCIDLYLDIYYGGDDKYKEDAEKAVEAKYQEESKNYNKSDYEFESLIEIKVYEKYKDELKAIADNSKDIKEIVGTWKPQLGDDDKAKIANPDAVVVTITPVDKNKLQIVDPVLGLDTSKPLTTMEEIENAKMTVTGTQTHVYDYTLSTDNKKKVLSLTSPEGVKGTITLDSDDTISVDFGKGSTTYKKV